MDGVPTITYTGQAYVSRMSTAVLNGANLSFLCASSVDQYIQIALDLASDISWLRSHRDHWRLSLQKNPLGDSITLLNSIKSCLRSILIFSFIDTILSISFAIRFPSFIFEAKNSLLF